MSKSESLVSWYFNQRRSRIKRSTKLSANELLIGWVGVGKFSRNRAATLSRCQNRTIGPRNNNLIPSVKHFAPWLRRGSFVGLIIIRVRARRKCPRCLPEGEYYSRGWRNTVIRDTDSIEEQNKRRGEPMTQNENERGSEREGNERKDT